MPGMSALPHIAETTEIEVTPEMIEVGIDTLVRETMELIGPREDEFRRAMAAAFRAMYALRPISSREDR
jgi:hypothetical protein